MKGELPNSGSGDNRTEVLLINISNGFSFKGSTPMNSSSLNNS